MVKLEIDYHSALSLADTLCRDNPNDARVKELRDWIANAGEIVKAGAEAAEELEIVKAQLDETAGDLVDADEKADDQKKEIDRLRDEISDKNTEIWNLQEEIKELRGKLGLPAEDEKPIDDKPAPAMVRALQVIAAYRSRPSVRLLDVIYGPQSKPLRTQVAAILLDRKVTGSDKEAQYGRLREILVNAVGAKGNCKAVEDKDFEARAEALLKSK